MLKPKYNILAIIVVIIVAVCVYCYKEREYEYSQIKLYKTVLLQHNKAEEVDGLFVLTNVSKDTKSLHNWKDSDGRMHYSEYEWYQEILISEGLGEKISDSYTQETKFRLLVEVPKKETKEKEVKTIINGTQLSHFKNPSNS